MNMPKKYLIILLMMSFGNFIHAQTRKNSGERLHPPISGVLIQPMYAYQIPKGDLAQRFSNNSWMGLGLHYKWKSNYQLGLAGGGMFAGSLIDNNALSGITNPDGTVIGRNGQVMSVTAVQRGFNINVEFGKLFILNKVNFNSGILVKAGLGFFQHKIFFGTGTRDIYQLDGDYKYGYDQLTNGYNFTGFLGYQYMSPNRRINLFAGVEYMAGFTQGRRNFNYNSRSAENQSRNDNLLSFKLGWMIVIFDKDNKAGEKEYIYN